MGAEMSTEAVSKQCDLCQSACGSSSSSSVSLYALRVVSVRLERRCGEVMRLRLFWLDG